MNRREELLPGARLLAGPYRLNLRASHHEALEGLHPPAADNPWAQWLDASRVDLAREVGQLLAKFGHLPAIDLSAVEKQSKEIK